MNELEQHYLQELENRLSQEQSVRGNLQKQYGELSQYSPEKDLNLVQYQLDIKEDLDRIYHLLSGHVLDYDDANNEVWKEPTDDRLKIFSDYGIKQIMNLVSWYINRNTLLSNYDDKTIRWKVRDFGIELADLIFNRYELFFYYPTPEELYEKYVMYIDEFDINEKELYNKCVEWSEQELRNKNKHYPIIVQSIIDSVHSAFNRALNGETLKSLRKFIHISEMTNQSQMQQPNKSFSLLKPSTWKK